MSKVGYSRKPFRIFTVKYTLFGKTRNSVAYVQTAKDAIKDTREHNLWSWHPSFEIKAVYMEEYR